VIWIPVGAWVAAAVIAVVVLGFCGYELAWKAKRLQADVRELQALAGRAQTLMGRAKALRAELADTQQNITAAARPR
jgi:hypothetical protein